MCGIAGYLGSRPLADARLAACRAAMRRRGPDAEGTFSTRTPDGRHLTLLHSRLAIIDLDPASNQPFRQGAGVLSYNGEVYNYLELREELERTGGPVATRGDTGILARILAERGFAGLGACEAMFALAWYDTGTGVLTLARDRFGEKPLYVLREADGTLFFGSEAKFVFALAGRVPAPNLRHLRRFLVNGYKALYKTRDTFFEGLEELPAGHLGICRPGAAYVETPWWRPRFGDRDDAMPYEEAVAGVRSRLIRSVALRLRADVPLAFCLSGGIDSNALIAIARRELGQDVHGFTVMNTDARYEERDMVEAAVRELALRHTPLPVDTADFLPNLRRLVRQHDAPVYTITYYAQWLLMEAIGAAGYKVSVSGTGADELFSGYYDHHNAYLAAMAAEAPQRHAEALAHWRRHVAPIVRNPFLSDPDYFIARPGARDHIYLDADVFSDFLIDPFAEPFIESAYTEPLLRNRMANELFAESVPVILHEDDLNAMYFSIENRSPFLDMALFDFMQRVPTRHLVRDGRAKALLRDAVRGLAPDVILDNPRKVGFNAPILDYLDTRDPAVRAELLADSPVFALLRRDRISALLDAAELPNSRSKFLFNFVNAKIFLEEVAA
ncbi:asparagine synthase (glutamine-hydrolyzing) [Rhabdaerophilum calidifontis]|uniref:asparagine synthase (glutamine-hydrolyzing) n=1 Tax=Rhabdaerophilum calidifontis TaxID=2604328 RepID=UPI00123905B9|nr:asparagine synthase (glutamine-hydrolyzing) [Rhabdaerophilum calidifontis]